MMTAERTQSPIVGTTITLRKRACGLAYELQLSNHPDIQLDDQHHEATWMRSGEVLASSLVHENTMAYFRETRRP